ncbi:transcription termination/antitermination protein NusA [Candidatus Uhrbacteria bacterium CG_4_9_14_0_2_um_filter_41_50]|uniref:Transcription termination/antitermination protein NusA n=1 Tax=Candidatus Uhrbacteria bacterium CG_4_9_14_0_2_um_filter_41_50 TaxID=1975031 RepID=A0A2M8EPV2_9BACT|nr:MAG: transcription termination/antitermination protein NusA [Candidatus Uhrbacteria bacterium CG_4_10_14_3_um_filter_41_21]PIZ54293.1 MAG: transcription termination/antitermination protein NusA [Candidatus Uhrbacteria bacterium CG_4_10_14_0_2_um_filter_41_21]PJB85048.1 MAG: transcription termination/antitermination protein NusA [Candidatus Uhrbacteria bacterium CG_4_9_14_0_8_um_filter_41_16]PJC24766.1 MAG: transcription termination/antitermination protein NusA [Candidatus Uhrbacteria bacteriu
MSSDIEQAIRFICEEKGLSYESVLETIEVALVAAYRKDYGNKQQNIEVEFDASNGDIKAFDIKTVVVDVSEEELEAQRARQAEKAEAQVAERAAEDADGRKRRARDWEPETGVKNEDADDQIVGEDEEPMFNPKTEIMISDARVLKMGSEVGKVLRIELPIPGEFGRMAAMTAKQVITQKLREAEREIVFNEYKEQEGEVLIGTIQRREGRVVLVDIGRTAGVMLPQDQVKTEHYNSGDRIKVYVREVSLGSRGPQILLSRSAEELIQALFELEVPEIAEETVKIKGIAREAGSRTKIAVATDDDTIDPIGACIGQRGVRIQTIINEIAGEKIDVIEWSEDPRTFILNALAPAKIAGVELNEEEKTATISVDPEQLSLAIGRGGQNVRLASLLSGWKLNIKESSKSEEQTAPSQDGEVSEPVIDTEEAVIDSEEANS